MTCCAHRSQVNHTCLECGSSCQSVSLRTMLHQVQFPDNQTIGEGDYAFCANRDCHIAYFSDEYRIPKASLRAYQSHQPAMLCYCFDISESNYRKALRDGSAKAMKSFVVQQTREKLCACEVRNPSGRCCLAEFKKMENIHDC